MRQPPHSLAHSAELPLPGSPRRRQAVLICLTAVLTCTAAAGLGAAAMVLHPPVAVVPLLLILCVGAPVLGTWELRGAISDLRRHHRFGHARALARFRRSLDRLPEVEHPLDR
jgi:hypothetical protein